MRINALALHHFRNHSELFINFQSGVTTIVGRNGLGKTNIIEAINYAATLNSHRVSTDEPLIQTAFNHAQIDVSATKHNRNARIKIELNRNGQNVALLNQAKVRRPRDIVGLLQVVVFSPEDLELVKGDPAVRRKFIDTFLMLHTPRVADLKQQYDRALKQRNTLLKSAGRRQLSESALQTLEVWDEQVSNYGAQLVAQRMNAVKLLNPHVKNFGEVISGGTESLNLTYHSPWKSTNSESVEEIKNELLSALITRRSEEIDRAITLSGPHRDDLTLSLGDNPVKGYASHGQSWSVAIALRLATFQALREHDGDPILILDDVFAELDEHRRDRLASVIVDAEQTIITVADSKDVPVALHGQVIELEHGTINVE